ncbi:unnamed protein product [Meganyctiphanes norvegica]|uniref:Uncharacterized protein n=1 Tax=Meganyctiphanes norvegica TaxID=48144 RepID=A0AAV2RJC1_MEGNR
MIYIPFPSISSGALSAYLPTLCNSGTDILHSFPYTQSMLSTQDKTGNTEHADDGISDFSVIQSSVTPSVPSSVTPCAPSSFTPYIPSSVTPCLPSPIPLQAGCSHKDVFLDKIERSEVKYLKQSNESSVTFQIPCPSIEVCSENKSTQRHLYADSDQSREKLTLCAPTQSQSQVPSLEELADINKSLVSIVEGVKDTSDIDNLVGTALLYQHMFNKKTSPWEMNDFDDGELNNFSIELEKLDRIYYVYHFDDSVASREYELLARMDYKGSKVFVQLSAGCDYTGFDCQGGGEIYVTKRPDFFLKSVVDGSNNPKRIWQALLDDGYSVCEPTEFDLLPQGLWQNVPMLKFLTHMAVYQHKEKLSFYPEVLPPLLRQSMDDFIQVRSTKDHHDT